MDETRNPQEESCESDALGELRLGLAALGSLRWAAVDLSAPLEDARRRLDLSPAAAVALGQTLTSATLLLRFTNKRPGRLAVNIHGDGPLGKVTAEVTHEGYLRGLVGEPQLATPADQSLASTAWAIGAGTLKVIQSNERGTYESQVELMTGEIGTDLVHYLEQSQQILSAALLGVHPCPDGIDHAGGILIEALPGTPEEDIVRLEKNIQALPGVSAALAEGGIDGLLKSVLQGFEQEELEKFPLRYGCGQGRDQILGKLSTLPDEELEELLSERDDFAADCAYCGRRFVFRREDIQSIH